MDPMTARWAQLKRFRREHIDEIHRLEKKAHNRNKETGRGSAANALSASMCLIHELNVALGKTWPPRTPEDHKAAEISRFEKTIFPIWKSLKDDYMAERIEDELDWIHQADLAIYNNPFSFQRKASASGGGELDRIKKGAAESKVGVERAVPD